MKRSFLYIAFIFLIAGCQNHSEKSRYEEIVLEPNDDVLPGSPLTGDRDPRQLLDEMMKRGEDPHAFLKNPGQETTQPPMGQMSDNPQLNDQLISSKTESPFSWSIPPEWTEGPASAMRLATFKNQKFPSIDISVVSLSGPAGGIFANINRWINQIHAEPLSENEFDTFMEKQQKAKSKEGTPITFIDLTTLSKADNENASGIFAAIVELTDKTVFIKMTGPVKDLQPNIKTFKEFCLTLRKK